LFVFVVIICFRDSGYIAQNLVKSS